MDVTLVILPPIACSTCKWYLIVGLAAGIFAAEYQPQILPHDPDAPTLDINIAGLIRGLWYADVLPYLQAFVVLNLIRLAILFSVWDKQWRRSGEVSG